MNRKRLYLGFILIFVSYASFSSEIGNSHKLLLAALFYLGVVWVCEWITISLAGTSLLLEIRKSWHNLFAFIFTAFLGGLLLDGVAKFLGKLWIYPDWSPSFYALIFIPGFAAYWLVICESYLALKSLIDFCMRGKKRIGTSYKLEKTFFKLLGIIGIILSSVAIILLYIDFKRQSLPFFLPENVYSEAPSFHVAFLEILLLFLGAWLLLEWIEFYRRKTSLLKDIMHHYYTPLIAIAAGSFITSVFMEAQNIPVGLWRYTNWPLSEISVFGVPVLTFIIWPLHYIAFLSLFRALTDKESQAIWRADTIK